MPHPRNPGFQAGNYWAACDRCGFEYRIKELKKTWDGLLVCDADWEPRNQQDFVKAVTDTITPQGPVRPTNLSKSTGITYTETGEDTIPSPTHGNAII